MKLKEGTTVDIYRLVQKTIEWPLRKLGFRKFVLSYKCMKKIKKLRVMKMKKTNGPRLQHFLQQIEGSDSFNEISIVKHDNDLEEFEVKKRGVMDDVVQNV